MKGKDLGFWIPEPIPRMYDFVMIWCPPKSTGLMEQLLDRFSDKEFPIINGEGILPGHSSCNYHPRARSRKCKTLPVLVQVGHHERPW